MKNKTGVISGFILGVGGFLLVFKLVFLDRIAPSDELAPGIVVIISVINGFVFAFIGSQIQNYFAKNNNYKI
jgi:hypothetical protein